MAKHALLERSCHKLSRMRYVWKLIRVPPDSVRIYRNLWPNSRLEAAKCVVPFGALYTPLKAMPEMPVVRVVRTLRFPLPPVLPACPTDGAARLIHILAVPLGA